MPSKDLSGILYTLMDVSLICCGSMDLDFPKKQEVNIVVTAVKIEAVSNRLIIVKLSWLV